MLSNCVCYGCTEKMAMNTKKITVSALLAWSVSVAYAKNPLDDVLSDMQNLWISSCAKSYGLAELATYDPITGFNVALHSRSPIIYAASIKAAIKTSNRKNCEDPFTWLEEIKNEIKNN